GARPRAAPRGHAETARAPARSRAGRGGSSSVIGSFRHSSCSYRPLHHQFLDLADRPGRVEVLRAGIDAVHDAMTAEQAVRILQVVEPLGGRLVAAVGDEPI